MMSDDNIQIIQSMIETVIDELNRIKNNSSTDDLELNNKVFALISILRAVNGTVSLDSKYAIELATLSTDFCAKKTNVLMKDMYDLISKIMNSKFNNDNTKEDDLNTN